MFSYLLAIKNFSLTISYIFFITQEWKYKERDPWVVNFLLNNSRHFDNLFENAFFGNVFILNIAQPRTYNLTVIAKLHSHFWSLFILCSI